MARETHLQALRGAPLSPPERWQLSCRRTTATGQPACSPSGTTAVGQQWETSSAPEQPADRQHLDLNVDMHRPDRLVSHLHQQGRLRHIRVQAWFVEPRLAALQARGGSGYLPATRRSCCAANAQLSAMAESCNQCLSSPLYLLPGASRPWQSAKGPHRQERQCTPAPRTGHAAWAATESAPGHSTLGCTQSGMSPAHC